MIPKWVKDGIDWSRLNSVSGVDEHGRTIQELPSDSEGGKKGLALIGREEPDFREVRESYPR